LPSECLRSGPGSHQIVADYGGDPQLYPSQATLTQTVTRAPTTLVAHKATGGLLYRTLSATLTRTHDAAPPVTACHGR
jgi:hypothetical protein